MRAAAAAQPPPPAAAAAVLVAFLLALRTMACEGRPAPPAPADDGGPLAGSDFLSLFLDSAEPRDRDPAAYHTERYARTSRRADPFEASPERSPEATEKLLEAFTLRPFSEVDEESTTSRYSTTSAVVATIQKSTRVDEATTTSATVDDLAEHKHFGKGRIAEDSSGGDKKRNPHVSERSIANPEETSTGDVSGASPSNPTSVSANTSDRSVIVAVRIDEKQRRRDQAYVASEPRHFIAANSKSELNVEEPEAITRDRGGSFQDGFPASVQQLPGPFNSAGFIAAENSGKVSPFHHSVIYHDDPKEPGKARSVSYSTVIQTVPDKSHDRRERNYDGAKAPFNNFEGDKTKNETKPSETTSGSAPTTTEGWDERKRGREGGRGKGGATTEGNWEKQYEPPKVAPKVYGKPEQNYEVDESVSLVTNGRAHGVQSSPVPAAKKDDNQKVGYVVEGRNYRKYRVEERTADGFIVGEYGVVSHDDGSLRGVRYTADGTINPKLIYDTLMKFLSL